MTVQEQIAKLKKLADDAIRFAVQCEEYSQFAQADKLFAQADKLFAEALKLEQGD